ncbi:MAG: hypothetical protein V1906_01185 [Candidatus Woesearchaeota archaeon]
MVFNLKKIAVLLIIVICSYTSLADSGITPAKTTINFYPNLEQQIVYTLFGYDDISYEISCEELITVDKITKEPGSHIVIATVKLPESLPNPGKKMCGIRFSEKIPPQNTDMISAQTGVGSVITINVPYPGKYAEITLEAPNANKGEPVLFKVSVNNLGNEVLNDIKADIQIEDVEEGKLVGVVQTNTKSIVPFKSGELYAIWNTKDFESARYKAKATVEYGGENPAIAEAQFMIGKMFIEFKDATRNGTSNKINPFEIKIESWWGEKLDNVYADVTMYNASGVNAGTFRTVSTEINSWETKVINGFWNAEQWGPGKYTADIKIKYEGQETPISWDFELLSPPEEKTQFDLVIEKAKANSVSILAIIILIIVIIDIIWIIMNRRRKKKGENQ